MTTAETARGRHRRPNVSGRKEERADVSQPSSGAAHGGHHVPHPGKTGSWVAVFLIIAAFILGALGMILDSVVLDIIAAVVFVAGLILAFSSKIFEQVE
jgi:hypothetical protein